MTRIRPQGRQAGYSLLELAVVLIVIGLLVFSVLKGATMIHQAKLRKIAQMVEDIRTASNLFYREQGRLPGDGKGGGALDGWIKQTGAGTEPGWFKKELTDSRYLSNKVSPSNTDRWETVLGGQIWVEYKNIGGFMTANFVVVTGLPEVEDREFFDLLFDDGVVTSGNVRYVSPELYIPL